MMKEDNSRDSCKVSFERADQNFRRHTPLKDIRFILAVGSGKGGVGKTTLSVLLSLALKGEGFSVGLFDLDFYGPNSALLLSSRAEGMIKDAVGFKPALIEGIKVASLGLMLSEREPIFMRGLMAEKLLRELTQHILWGPLDFLILDLPPGTGDIFLSMLDLFAPDGFILITTPHKLSLSDSLRTISILREKRVPLLGIIKNMGDLFGSEENFNKFLQEARAPLLFELPFIKEFSEKETLSDLVEMKKEFLEDLSKAILKKVFRFQ